MSYLLFGRKPVLPVSGLRPHINIDTTKVRTETWRSFELLSTYPDQEVSMSIDPASLARRVRDRRLSTSKGIREAAADADISSATLSRVERGDYVPGRENLLKIAAWLGIT